MATALCLFFGFSGVATLGMLAAALNASQAGAEIGEAEEEGLQEYRASLKGKPSAP